MTTPLKSCPHCGAKNCCISQGHNYCYAQCFGCKMFGPNCDTAAEAAAAWNALPRPSDVTALKARAEAAEAERDRLAARVAELEASIQTEHYRAQRDLLLSLWREIEGDQDGDAPGNHLLEAGLVAAARARDERTEWLEARVAELEAEAAALVALAEARGGWRTA